MAQAEAGLAPAEGASGGGGAAAGMPAAVVSAAGPPAAVAADAGSPDAGPPFAGPSPVVPASSGTFTARLFRTLDILAQRVSALLWAALAALLAALLLPALPGLGALGLAATLIALALMGGLTAALRPAPAEPAPAGPPPMLSAQGAASPDAAVSALPPALEVLPVAFLRLHPDGRVLDANLRARQLLAHPMNGEVDIATLLEGPGRSLRDWLAGAAEGRGLRRTELVRARRGEGERWLQMTLAPESRAPGIGAGEAVLSAVLLDATELRSLQAQFTQGQKMQAVGQLAGGVAHDFNNLLTAISGHCDLLLLRHDEGDPDYADLMQIHQNANRAAGLVSQLLAFSRKQTLRPRVLDLRETISDLTHLLQRLTGERVRLTFLHDHDLAPVRADPRQIEQVLLNLVVNARDAMGGAGDIRIETRNLLLEAPLTRDRATLPAGRYVRVSVGDTGCGIPPDRLSKVFEPFFTTKRQGEGTGLGLSTVYGIVKQSGGFIFADSRLGEGSSFHIYLPATRALPAQARARAAAPAPRTGARPSGRILLVEDEAPVRAFAARALRLCGHEVLEADSGERALEILADPSVVADLYITDVVMPGLGGPDWVRAARAARAPVPVIFISGYAEEGAGIPEQERQDADFLPKPFSLAALTEAVARRLEPAAQPAAPPAGGGAAPRTPPGARPDAGTGADTGAGAGPDAGPP